MENTVIVTSMIGRAMPVLKDINDNIATIKNRSNSYRWGLNDMMLPPSQPIRRSQPPDSGPIGRRSNQDRYDLNALNSIQNSALSNLDDPKLQQEINAYAKIPLSERQMYAGQYVAVYNGKIVDCDSVEAVLIDRFYRRYGYVRVLIHAVGIEDDVLDQIDLP